MQFLSRTGCKWSAQDSHRACFLVPGGVPFVMAPVRNFLTASVFILFEAWARNQDYLYPHPRETLLLVVWPKSHSRHCELELGCDIYRKLMHIITQQMSAVVVISFTCTCPPLVAPQSFIGL